MDANKFDEWCILEIMGHQRFAGRVTEQSLGGASFVRIDVPECPPDKPAFSKLFGAGSIYAISPVTEKVARLAAQQFRKEPLSVYDLPDEILAKLRKPALPDLSTASDFLDGEEEDWEDE